MRPNDRTDGSMDQRLGTLLALLKIRSALNDRVRELMAKIRDLDGDDDQ